MKFNSIKGINIHSDLPCGRDKNSKPLDPSGVPYVAYMMHSMFYYHLQVWTSAVRARAPEARGERWQLQRYPPGRLHRHHHCDQGETIRTSFRGQVNNRVLFFYLVITKTEGPSISKAVEGHMVQKCPFLTLKVKGYENERNNV